MTTGDPHEILIRSDTLGWIDTLVIVDGEPLENVRQIDITVEVDEPTTAVLHCEDDQLKPYQIHGIVTDIGPMNR